MKISRQFQRARFRNGERVQEATLVAGDSVQLGPVVFVLQIDGVPADDQLQPLIAPPAVEQAPAAAAAPPAEEGVIPVIDAEGDDGSVIGRRRANWSKNSTLSTLVRHSTMRMTTTDSMPSWMN